MAVVQKEKNNNADASIIDYGVLCVLLIIVFVRMALETYIQVQPNTY